jgi:hypothetical protein
MRVTSRRAGEPGWATGTLQDADSSAAMTSFYPTCLWSDSGNPDAKRVLAFWTG